MDRCASEVIQIEVSRVKGWVKEQLERGWSTSQYVIRLC